MTITAGSYAPYLPRLAIDWYREDPRTRLRVLDGTLVSVDISGFTALSEQLAARGKIGAEELIRQISRCYDGLIGITLARGGDVLKFRGDALLLFFGGDGHETRATAAALEMQTFIETDGQAASSVGLVSLGMAAGVVSGSCHFFLVGGEHRELIVAGPGASRVLQLEDLAQRGEVLVSARTAEALDPAWVGDEREGARLVRRDAEPPEPDGVAAVASSGDDLADLVPPPLREILAGGRAEAEHRHATAAFVKFSGTDALVADEAEAAARVDELARVVSDATSANGVTWLESDIDVDGGKLYLVAGAPSSHGGDEERMLRAVRAIIDAGVGPPIAVGVNRGHVFAGEIGSPARRTYAVMGDTVNLAARLTARAQKGKILATGAVLERSRARFETEPQQFLMKGKGRPITAYHVGAAIEAQAEARAHDLPLVGREREVRVLREALDAARMRRTTVVELVGEPGIGKSRLVTELSEQAVGFTKLESRSEEYAATTPYFAVRAILRQLVGIAPDAPADAAGAQLLAFVPATMPDLAPWLPLLAIPFGADVPPTAETDELDAGFRQRKLHEVVDAFLTRMLLMPTLLLFEDAHWMDDASSLLLRHVSSQSLPRPWVMCITRRPYGAPVARDNAVVLELEPLDEAALAELALAAAADQALPPEALAELAARSGGNPLFLRELVAAGPQATDGALPERVETVITARIDTLDPTDRLLLRCAAVIGATFDLDLLGEILASDTLAPGDPDRWARLSEFVGWEGDRLRFKHDLFRAVGYEGLSYERRRDLHRRVGEALERRADENAEEAAALLSLHFYEAGDYDKAWGYSVVAADNARERFANLDAAELYSRALAAAAHLTPDQAEMSRIAEALGDVYELAARYEAAATAFERARSLAADPVAEARLMLKDGKLREHTGDYDDALRWFGRGLVTLRGVHGAADALSYRAGLELECATVRYRQGRLADTLRWTRRAARNAERAGDRRALAHAYRHMSVALRDLGRPNDVEYLERALPIYEEIGDLVGKAIVLNNLGVRSYFAGRWNEALDYYAQAGEAQRRAGDGMRSAIGANNVGEILLDQGRLEEARALFEDALRIFRAIGYRIGDALATLNLARVATREQRFGDGRALIDEARAAFDAIGAASFVLEADARRAEALVLEGDHRAAFDLATATLDSVAALGEVGTRNVLLERARGYALYQARRADDARAHFDSSLATARDLGAEYELALTMRALADTGASEYGPLAQVIFDRLGVIDLPQVPLP